MKCLKGKQISCYLDGEEPGLDLARVRDHLRKCPRCRALIKDVLASARLAKAVVSETGGDCPEESRLQDSVVSEVDPTLQKHLDSCPSCSAAFSRLRDLIELVDELQKEELPPVPAGLDRSTRDLLSTLADQVPLRLVIEPLGGREIFVPTVSGEEMSFLRAAEAPSRYGAKLRLELLEQPAQVDLTDPETGETARIRLTRIRGQLGLDLSLQKKDRPCTRTRVELSGPVQLSGETDPEGNVSFAGLVPGRVRIKAGEKPWLELLVLTPDCPDPDLSVGIENRE